MLTYQGEHFKKILHNDLYLQEIFARCILRLLTEDQKKNRSVFERITQNVCTSWLKTAMRCYHRMQDMVILLRDAKQASQSDVDGEKMTGTYGSSERFPELQVLVWYSKEALGVIAVTDDRP